MLPQDIERINRLARKIGKTIVVIDTTAGRNVVVLGLDEFERIIELESAVPREDSKHTEDNKKTEPYEGKSLTGRGISDSINRSKTGIDPEPQGREAPSVGSEKGAHNPFTFPKDTYDDLNFMGSIGEDPKDPDESGDIYYLEPTEEEI